MRMKSCVVDVAAYVERCVGSVGGGWKREERRAHREHRRKRHVSLCQVLPLPPLARCLRSLWLRRARSLLGHAAPLQARAKDRLAYA